MVDVFIPDVQCETADLTYVPSPTDIPYYRVSSKTCPSYEANEAGRRNPSSALFVEGSGCGDICPQKYQQYEAWRINCSVPDFGWYTEDLESTTPFDFRLLVSVMNITIVPVWYYDTGFNDTKYSSNITLASSTSLLCKIGYHMNKATVTYVDDNFSNIVLSNASTTKQQLKDLTDQQLTEILWSSMWTQPQTQTTIYSSQKEHNGSYPFTIIKAYLNATSSPEVAFTEQSMKEALSASLANLASLFMVQSYSAAGSLPINASGIFSEQRLHVKIGPLVVMIVALVFMSIFSVVMALFADTPEKGIFHLTWLEQARVLSTSREVQGSLRPLHDVSTARMEQALSSYRFKTVQGDSLRIEMTGQKAGQTSPEHDHQPGGWTPLAARWYMLILTCALPLLAIVILEILYQESKKHNGLLSISGGASVPTYAIRYTSTFIVFNIATLFSSLDFSIAILTPFTALRSGKTTMQKSYRFYLLGYMPPVALLKALMTGQIGAAFSLTAASAGSVLTIIVSGLWLAGSSMGSHEVEAARASLWDLNWNTSNGDNGAAVRFNSIQHGGLAPSSTIWDEFVLPNIADVVSSGNSSGSSASIVDTASRNFTFVLPALRPQILSEAVARSSVEAEYLYQDTVVSKLIVSAAVEQPDLCLTPGSMNRTVNFTTLYNSTSGPLLTRGPLAEYLWYGGFIELSSATYRSDSSVTFATTTTNQTGEHLDRPGCPVLGLHFGYISTKMSKKEAVDHATALICYQRLQQVPLKVSFVGNPSEMQFDMTHPPLADEQQAVNLSNSTSGLSYFQYPTLAALGDNVATFNTANATLLVDPLTNILLFGPNGTGLDAVLGDANQGTLITAVQRSYTSYMLQVVDLNFRQSTTSAEATTDKMKAQETMSYGPSQSKVLQGTMSTSTLRLRVDETSKLTLQILLAVMVVLGAMATMLVDLREVLPRCPCSIASTMALLAGSGICERLASSGRVAFDQKLGLGWWDSTTSSATGTGQRAESNYRETGDGDETAGALDTGGHRGLRFGIDFGQPDEPGFRREERRWWSRRKRT